MRRALPLLLLAACAAPDRTEVQGRVQGAALSAPVAVYAVIHGTPRDALRVLISDDPQACAHLGVTPVPGRPGVDAPVEGRRPSLLLDLPQVALPLGTARVGQDLSASFDPGLGSTDCVAFLGPGRGLPDLDAPADAPAWLVPPCGAVGQAGSGSARLDRADDSGASSDRAAGRFDLRFPDGERLEGTFLASPCSALGN